MQRFARPAIFVLILAVVLFMALLTGRGENLTQPFMVGRFADFAQGSPLLSTLFSIVLLPLALFLCLFPEDSAITMAVGNFGFWFGVLVSTYAITAVGGTTCTLAKSLLQGTIRRIMAARRQAGKSFSHRAVLPLEYCLLVEVVLLVCNAPAVFAGLVLGLVGMRTKSFCVAAVPILLARTSIIALGTQEAGLFRLLLLCLFGTVLFVLSLAWVCMLVKKRMAMEREEAIRALVKTSEVFREPRPAFEDIALDDVERSGAEPGRDNLSLARTLMVLVREGTVRTDNGESADSAAAEPDLVAKLAEEGRGLGLRVLVRSMDESAASAGTGEDGRERIVPGGFDDTDVVADLGELFGRGFQEGADTVIAVRAASPLVGGEVLARAVEAVKKSGLVLVPLMGEERPSFCLVALTSPFGGKRFEQELLKRRHFGSDIAFALTGYAPHPEVLRPLPHVSLCRPLVSVVLVAETASTTLFESIRRVRTSAFAECVAVLLPEAVELEKEALALGAAVLKVDDIRDVNGAVAKLAGSIVLFAPAGVLLPERFEEAVWQCMEKERCVLGNFALPPQVPGLQRALRWLGSSVKPGRGSGPVLLQGIFLGRDDFVRFGGFESQDIEQAVNALVQRAHLEGDVVPHNWRVSLAGDGAAAGDASKDATIDGAKDGAKGGARGLGKFGLARLFRKGRGADELVASAREAMDKAREMVEDCDHCGRCTHVSPMLHKHNVDLADLPKKPLLAWHCFLCGACTAACHKGIDAMNLVRTLRKAYVARHGNRVSRPGHGKTVALQKMVGVFAKTALPGRNLLLDADFCCAWPRTALALARKMRSWNIGVVIAEPGARAMDLGLESGARKKVRALRSVMDQKGITGFYTIQPTTHACLVGMGIACEPVYTVLREMGQEHVDLAGRHLLDAAFDRAHEAFANALNPLLDGERRPVDVPCCGAGGEAAVVEPKLSRDLKNAVKSVLKPKERVLTTSTQCAESLSHAGIPCDHALTALMGLTEAAASGPGQISALVKTLVAVSSLSADRDGKDDRGSDGAKGEGRVAFVKGLFGKFMNMDGTRDGDIPAAPLDIQMPDRDGQQADRQDGGTPDAEQAAGTVHEPEIGLGEGESGAEIRTPEDPSDGAPAGEACASGSGDGGEVLDGVDEDDARDENRDGSGVGSEPASADVRVTPGEDVLAGDVDVAREVSAEGNDSSVTHEAAEEDAEEAAEEARKEDLVENRGGDGDSEARFAGEPAEDPGRDGLDELQPEREVDLEETHEESCREDIDEELEENPADIKGLSQEASVGENAADPDDNSNSGAVPGPMPQAEPEARVGAVASDVTEKGITDKGATEKGVVERHEAEEPVDSEAEETEVDESAVDAPEARETEGEMDAETEGAARAPEETGVEETWDRPGESVPVESLPGESLPGEPFSVETLAEDSKPVADKSVVSPVVPPVVRLDRAVSLKSYTAGNTSDNMQGSPADNEGRR